MKNRFLIVFISIFIAAVMVVGGALALVAGIRSARALVTLGDVSLDEGGVRYFAAYYKMVYLKTLNSSGIRASDTDEFWQSEKSQGVSYAMDFESSLKDYLASLIAAANLYLSYSSYTPADKLKVSETTDEILEHKADGSVAAFNEACGKYGFNYNDFQNAAALLYKAGMARETIYGADGAGLANYPDQCALYLDTYARVSLLFVRTEQIFDTDSEGNYIYEDDGSVALRDMTVEEKAARQEIISALRTAIEAKNSGNDMQITPVMFENYLEKSDGDPSMYQSGYYFNERAETTAEFAEAFEEVVKASLEMEIGDYREVECSIGVCFIYRYAPDAGAYADSDNVYFSDFYSDAADYLYARALDTLSDEVTFKDGYYDIDVASIPKIEEFYIRSFK